MTLILFHALHILVNSLHKMLLSVVVPLPQSSVSTFIGFSVQFLSEYLGYTVEITNTMY
jgi:hypothetical protein